jgi:endonuclease/exonuclease/phosphatase family metal-dependent hydrolase
MVMKIRTCLIVVVSTFFITLMPAVLGEPLELRILTYNIHHVEGTDGKIDYERMAAVIQELNPDIVALQEVDNETERTEGVNQVEKLAGLAGYEHFVFGRSMPYGGGEYGLAVMSRYPILENESHPLPFRFTLEPRSVLITRIKVGENGRIVTLADTHLCHQSEENRIDQVRRINSLLGEVKGPVLLAGDFNARKGNDSMRIMWSRDWLDLSSSHSRIDYILSRKQDGLKVTGSWMIEDRLASDHFPVLVQIEMPFE